MSSEILIGFTIMVGLVIGFYFVSKDILKMIEKK
jgi:uncharacterized protein YneF (UPF0154 family)